MDIEKFRTALEKCLREISEAFASGDWSRIEPLLPPVPKGYVRHIIKEGARYHVVSYDSQGPLCNVEKCEINKAREETR